MDDLTITIPARYIDEFLRIATLAEISFSVYLKDEVLKQLLATSVDIRKVLVSTLPTKHTGKRTMSAEGRAAIVEAQRKRWAAVKRRAKK